MGALDGILVVALEQAVAAPLCTARLAEAGARVIKLERAEGDFARNYDHVVHGESAYFVWLNRGKESVRIDIKAEADRALLDRLLVKADVFIQNLAPGATARAGYGSDALRAKYPRLITCDITGYGEHGPAAKMKAYDFLIQCEAGLASVTGTDDAPARVGVSIADIGCGMNAHAGILQALYERERTGKGRGISVSLFDGVADWMTVPLLHHDYGGKAPKRAGLSHPSIAPYGAFAAQGGQMVVISVQNEREWLSFCATVLQRPDLASDGRFVSNSQRCAHRGELDAQIAGVFAQLPPETLIGRLEEAAIAWARLNEVDGLSRHTQLRRVQADTPTGPVRLPATPTRWDRDSGVSLAVPALHEHDRAVRAEFAGT